MSVGEVVRPLSRQPEHRVDVTRGVCFLCSAMVTREWMESTDAKRISAQKFCEKVRTSV